MKAVKRGKPLLKNVVRESDPGTLLQQQSFAFNRSRLRSVSSKVDEGTLLTRACENMAREAFSLPTEFSHVVRRQTRGKMQLRRSLPDSSATQSGYKKTLSRDKPKMLEHPQRMPRDGGESLERGRNSRGGSRERNNGRDHSVEAKDVGRNGAEEKEEGVEEGDMFDLLAYLFGFQRDSVNNQRENAMTLLGSRLARSVPGGVTQNLSEELLNAVLLRWRNEQLFNYRKWCKHVWTWQVKLRKVLPNDPKLAHAFEVSLSLLLWGEGANLRLCPEFLCWVHHKSAGHLRDVLKNRKPEQFLRSYLKEVIKPCYNVLSEQLEDKKGVDTAYIKNYDDFNETFWQRSCLSLDIKSLTEDALRSKFTKTFVERQSWIVPLVSFWRVQMLLFFGLHLLITIAVCNRDEGCPGSSNSYWYRPVFTLTVCYLLVDVYEIVFVLWRKIIFQCHLLSVTLSLTRTFAKTVILAWFYTVYPGEQFYNSARLYYALVALLEFLKFTPIMGRMQGRVGPWNVAFNVMLGIDAATTYVRVDRLPKLGKVLSYTFFWLVILGIKLSFNYFFMIRPLVDSTIAIWDLDVGGVYDLGFITFQDRHNVGVLVGLWISVLFVYFIDLQVWFIVAESIASAYYGMMRLVGERRSPKEICGSFERMYRVFFHYLGMEEQQKHFRFAYVWNEVVDTMRQEDIIDDKEMSGLKYFVVSLHRPNSVLALLPGFLVSGKIQGTVTQANDFARQNDDLIKELIAMDVWGDEDRLGNNRYKGYHRAGPDSNGRLHDMEAAREKGSFVPSQQMKKLQREQRKFLRSVLHITDPIREVAFLHLFLSLFFLMEHLCEDKGICQGLWEVYEYVNSAAAAVGREGVEESAIEMLLGANPNRVIFLLHKWPDLINALEKVVDTILKGNYQGVKKCMDKLCQTLVEFIDPTGGTNLKGSKYGQLFHNLKLLQTALESWPKSGKINAEDVSMMHKDNYEFLQRFYHLITSTNRPGHVGSWEGQRRIAFFVNSMYMAQPQVSRVETMPAFSTLTPYYSEEVILSLHTLCARTPDGVTTLEYLQTLFPQQWASLVERMRRTFPSIDFAYYAYSTSDFNILNSMDPRAQHELQLWASYRAQTLARTVRGMMYYQQAIQLLAVVETEDFSEELYSNVEMTGSSMRPSDNPLYDKDGEARFVSVLHGKIKYSAASMEISNSKFTYLVSCQQHSKLLRSSNPVDKAKAQGVELLMEKHPALKVSYVDTTRDGRHLSVLIKYDKAKSRIVKQYEVELPGPILVGEGKPNNQNHAIIFTRGEAIQAIDMNQDGALEDALKIRQLLGEFDFNAGGNRAKIVGFREFVFTHDVSSIANFFSLQELSFVTSIQRFLDKPLAVRFHYGHPDMFDKVSAITLGGISKASKGINLSEDIFGGFNFVLRGGTSTQAEYIQVGKGRDVGLGQIAGFVAKISMGNGMQSRSREVYRLAQQLDLFRLLSFYYTSVGFYLNQVFLILSIYLFVYAKVYLVFDRRQDDLSAINEDVARIVSSQYVFQLGFMLVVPILLVMAVEHGLAQGLRKFVEIMLRGSVLFFVFLSATNAYYVNLAFLTGQAKYMSTGRGFVIVHEHFLSVFRQYLQSHFVPAFEILVLIVVYWYFGTTSNFLAETFSVWLLVVAWLWSPMIFNPNGVEWMDVFKDFDDWVNWMTAEDDDPSKSWHAWWAHQNVEVSNILMRKKVILAIWRCRFLILVWGFVAAMKLSRIERGQSAIGFQWILLFVLGGVGTILFMRGIAACGARLCSSRSSTRRRLATLIIALAGVGCIIFLPLFGLVAVEQMLYYFGAVGFLLYFIVVEASLVKGNMVSEKSHSNSSVMASSYWLVHFTIGLVIMVPIMVVAFFPFAAHFQTRMLFNQNFSARFTSAKLFATERERQDAKKSKGVLPPPNKASTSTSKANTSSISSRTKAS